MPNFKQHTKAGGLIGLMLGTGINLYLQSDRKEKDPNYQFNWGQLLASSLGGYVLGWVAGALPDILEPARHPNHRKFFHSVTTAASIVVLLRKINMGDAPIEHKSAANIAGAGYLSHLLLDMGTTKGLPII